MEYEAVVVKLSSSEALRVHHHLERFNPLTYRGGNTRIGGRGRPYSETSRNYSGGNGKQTCRARAHLNSPIPISSAATSRLIGSGMPDYSLGRCDGHHEMVDFGLRRAMQK
jgi:hypothetical protein